MNAENLIVYYSCYRETVEALDKLFPQLQRIPSFALVIKSVNLGNGLTFMVTSQQEDTLRIFDFISHEQTDRFNTEFASIHVVTKEKIVRKWRMLSCIQEPG